MHIIIGLGNPGKEYTTTWHNVGFLVLDMLGSTTWKEGTDKNALLQKIKHPAAGNIILAKPTTFMNNSGIAAQHLLAYYKATPEELIVVHDDIDLPLGTLRISQGASAGGHRGVQSVIDHTSQQGLVRVRVGIRPATMNVPTDVYVLQKIPKNDMVAVQDSITKSVAAIHAILEDGIVEAMNQFN